MNEAGGEEDAAGEGVHERDDAGHLGERLDDGQREQAAEERLEEDDEEQANLERGGVIVVVVVVVIVVSERDGGVGKCDSGEQRQELGPTAAARKNLGGGHGSVTR